MIKTYDPRAYTIYLGLPVENTVVDTLLTDWVSMTSQRPGARFKHSRGIFGESFLEMSQDSSRIFTISILQGSTEVVTLRDIYTAQLAGIVGIPFVILESGDAVGQEGTIFTNRRAQKSIYPVAWITDEPKEVFNLTATAWEFTIQTAGGFTQYI